MTLDIPFGKTTAIVGESGSGKTTLMKLLLKFYDKYDGTILYGNAELKDISARSLREHCGVVMQDGYIFSDTLERNIATGKQPIDQEKLKKAIDIAQLTEFVENLPQGLKTQLGTGGMVFQEGNANASSLLVLYIRILLLSYLMKQLLRWMPKRRTRYIMI